MFKPSNALTTLGVALLAAHASAETLSINFFDTNADAMLPGDVAGVAGSNTRVSFWNNVQAAASGNGSGFVYNTGAASTASLSFTTDLNTWRLPFADVTSGDDRMWKGYLDAAGAGAFVTVSGLEFIGAYDVYIYFDGDNGTGWRVANFSIGAITEGGEDSESTNWGDLAGQNTTRSYQLPVPGAGGNQPFGSGPTNNDEGNYIVLSGITGDSFTLSAIGGPNSGAPRAPINGFQIVGTVVPEPGTAFLACAGASLIALRRRRSAK